MKRSYPRLAILFVLCAAAANSSLAAICNTVIGKSAMGQSHTHYKANHTFDAALSNGQGSMETDGTWGLNDKGELCRTYNTPVPGMPNPSCVTWVAHKVGDSWQITVDGRTSEVTLVAGIQ
jgi:predicted 3-demethylubiquinone-9 3-methyltransferase (glyoxalase superfamily)